MKLSESAEDILEALWIGTVEADQDSLPLVAPSLAGLEEGLRELEGRAFVEIRGERLFLRQEGRAAARMTVRRHRLAERLLMDILDLKGEQGDARACEFEHLLRDGVDTKICTLLNHPTTCPHGKPIPPGSCCEEARRGGETGVVTLTELSPGSRGEIAYLSAEDPMTIQKLMSMGVLPGNQLELIQAFPSYIFRIGHSQFAVDEALAREIFVRRGA